MVPSMWIRLTDFNFVFRWFWARGVLYLRERSTLWRSHCRDNTFPSIAINLAALPGYVAGPGRPLLDSQPLSWEFCHYLRKGDFTQHLTQAVLVRYVLLLG